MGLAPVAIGAMVGGSILSAYNQRQQGQEAAAAAEFNRRVTLLAAGDAIQRGQVDAGRARLEGSKVIGEQRAAIAASGIDPSTGSAASLATETRAASELDALTIQNNAYREAWGLKTQASLLGQQASAARRAGNLGAFASILGGAGQAALGYKTFYPGGK